VWLSVFYIITTGYVSIFIIVVGGCAQGKHFPRLLYSLSNNDTNYGKAKFEKWQPVNTSCMY